MIRIFHLTNPNPPTVKDIFLNSLEILGLDKKIELINDKKYQDPDFYNKLPKQKISKEIAKSLHDLLPYLFLKTKFEVRNTNEALENKYNPEKISKSFLEDVLKHRYSPNAQNDFIERWERKRPLEIIPKEYKHKEIETGKFEQKTINITLKAFEKAMKLFFKPSGIEDVQKLYSAEAKNYDFKHHLASAYNDTKLRKEAASYVENYLKSIVADSELNILDIATGTGLTMEEIDNVINKDEYFQKKINLFGIDFTEAMLERGEKRIKKENRQAEILLKKGDATNFIEKEEGYAEDGLYRFRPDSMDCITDVFGIGGINNPEKCFEQQLRVLKEGGISIMMDMHAPSLEEKDTRMPLGLSSSPSFVQQSWEKVTKPIALKKLWGWNDPTEYFYTMPLSSYFDEQKKKYFGFELVKRNIENLKWWFGLPVMSVAREIVKKVEISKGEFLIKQSLLKNIKKIDFVEYLSP